MPKSIFNCSTLCNLQPLWSDLTSAPSASTLLVQSEFMPQGLPELTQNNELGGKPSIFSSVEFQSNYLLSKLNGNINKAGQMRQGLKNAND
jgi:hypothetical protein